MQARGARAFACTSDFAIIPVHALPMKVFAKPRKQPPEISWEQILNSVEDGVIAVDPSGAIVFFNEAAEVLTEVSSAKALQDRFERLFAREAWLLELARKAWPPLQESARGEGELLTRWGRKAPVSAAASPLRDRHGRFQGAILLLRDIKHRKELEQDLKRADRLAITGTIAAGLAHEIRNPLGGIKGAAQLLRRSLEPASALRPYTEIMIREVERVNQLIEQLLDLSRPSALQLVPLNIHEILDEVLLLETEDTGGRELSIRKRYDPSLPPIRGDRARLTQVFLNLIKNAIQSMENAGAVTITTRLETDYHIREAGAGRNRFIWVEVADQGGGIREEDLAHIFSPFFTTRHNGTGLGLAICYRIVQEHGGLIRVESIEGEGSTFKVALVVAD
ncbi:MAG TPA: ATP-binding protein [Chthoniobacterales bacterium]|nr:ATP-binding protein [Chthoniobacterales bacterium]